jgi:hypothetical protein
MISTHSLSVALGIAFGLAMPVYAQAPAADAQTAATPSVKPAEQGPAGALKDPIELCEKLAGVEREICVRQARENRAADTAVGATPGSGGTVTGGAAAERK